MSIESHSEICGSVVLSFHNKYTLGIFGRVWKINTFFLSEYPTGRHCLGDWGVDGGEMSKLIVKI